MGLWGVVKYQGVGVYLFELQHDEVNFAYEGSEKDKTTHDALTALESFSPMLPCEYPTRQKPRAWA
jgi:hypothetical protein